MDPVHCIASLFRRWHKKISLLPTDNVRFGVEGERIAERYLRKRGFRILYRNFRSSSGGEIDLVCRDRTCLVFVEVKRRRSNRFGEPSLAVSNVKQHLLVRGATAWLRFLGNPEVLCRFDVVELIGEGDFSEIRHIRDAFPVPSNLY